MEGERKTYEKIDGSEDDLPDSSNIFQSSRIRRSISCSDELDRIFLGNRFNLLFHVSPIFWVLFFTGKILR